MLKRFAKNKRGVSTVIGAVFFVLILLGGFSMIIWEITEYDNYMQVVNERDQLEREKQNEIIEIDSVYVVGDSLNISVVNNGAVTAHLVDLWVTEYVDETTANWHSFFQINYYANPGDTIANIGHEIEMPELDPEYNYMIKIVTERGNIVTKMYKPEDEPETEPDIEPGTGGALVGGPFLLEFSNDAFQYTSDNNPTSPLPAFRIDNDRKRIIFSILFYNRADRGIQISQLSFFLVEVRELSGSGEPGTTEYERYFHIVGSTSTSNPSGLVSYPDYDQTIPPRENATLKFGASTVGGTSFLDPTGTDYTPLQGDRGNGNGWSNLLWTFIVIFWRYEPTPEEPIPPTFGQTIAYVAILTDP